MTTQSRAVLKSKFETGDAPRQKDFSDLIDSALNLVDTGTQTFTSPIATSSLAAVTVSAEELYTDFLSVNTLKTTRADVTIVNANEVSATNLHVAGTLNANIVSAQVVRASSVHHKNFFCHVADSAVFTQNDTFETLTTASGAFGIISATSLIIYGQSTGFTTNGNNRTFYISASAPPSNVTAVFRVSYILNVASTATVPNFTAALMKNLVVLPESKTRYDPTAASISRGTAIVKLAPSNSIGLATATLGAGPVVRILRTYSITILPVSWEF